MENEIKKEPKLRKPKVAAEETKAESNVAAPTNDVVSLLTDLVGEVKSMSERLNKLEQAPAPSPVRATVQSKSPDEKRVEGTYLIMSNSATSSDSPQPIFEAMKSVATEVLGEDFSYNFQTFPGQSMFSFTITVPEHIELKSYESRERTKFIPNSDGENGVRDWAMLVKQNLVQMLQAAGKTLN